MGSLFSSRRRATRTAPPDRLDAPSVLADAATPPGSESAPAHLFAAPCLPDALYARLLASFPTGDAAVPAEAKVLRIVSSRALQRRDLDPAWREFIENHTAQAFWQRVVARFGDAIRRQHPELEAQLGKPLQDWRALRRHAGASAEVLLECQLTTLHAGLERPRRTGLPGPAARNRLWTGVLQLRLPDDQADGGELELGSSAERRVTLPYRANSFAAFVSGHRAPCTVAPHGRLQRPRRYVELFAEVQRPAHGLLSLAPGHRRWFRFFPPQRLDGQPVAGAIEPY